MYEANQKAFTDRVHRAMFGDDLVDLIGGEQLVELQQAGTLMDFLENDFGLEGLQDNLEVMELYTPEDFKTNRNNYLGSAWGVEPKLTQSASFRPGNKSEDIDNFYIVYYHDYRVGIGVQGRGYVPSRCLIRGLGDS